MESISISTAQQNLRVHYINVVDLFKLQPSSEHPHGLPDRDFDSLFTAGRPIIFNNTPMGLAINNEIDRFTVAIEVIDRTPKLQRIGAHVKEQTVMSKPVAATILISTA